MSSTKQRLRAKWNAIETGEIPDDYTNHFLSHFGFADCPDKMEKSKQNRDAYYADALVTTKIGSNTTEFRSHD